MGLFSKFGKKSEAPQTHTEPEMSGSLSPDAVNQEFAGKEPGFNRNENSVRIEPQNFSASRSPEDKIPTDSSKNAETTKTEDSFLSSGPKGFEKPAEPKEPSQPVQNKETSLSAPKEFIPSPRKVFPEPKPSKETSEQINSSQEQFRQIRRIRARRRFIGAVMLLTLVVVTVPFLFDKEPPPPAVTIPLRIPSESSVNVANIQVPGGTTALASSTQTESKEPVVAAEPKKTEPAKPAKDNQPIQSVKKDNQAKANTAQQEAKKPETKKEQSKPQPKEAAKPAAAAGKGTYYVQVAAFSNEGRAKELLKKIQGAGVPGYLEQVAVKNGKVWRVRAGNFPNSKAAEDARGRIGLLGLTGKVGQIK